MRGKLERCPTQWLRTRTSGYRQHNRLRLL